MKRFVVLLVLMVVLDAVRAVSLPVLYTKGSHYEIGHDIVRDIARFLNILQFSKNQKIYIRESRWFKVMVDSEQLGQI